jgi:uncharacterized repeat protein (TIGR01451 family)
VAPHSRRKTQLCRGVAKLLLAAAAALPVLVGSAQASREARGALVVTSLLERLVPSVTGGETTMLEPGAAAAASHADQLVYTARFTNRGDQLLDSVRITSAIPAELAYVPQSASGPASTILFSVDGGETFRPAAELEIVRPDGTRRRADPVDYTHVRWVIDGAIDPGATGVVRFGAVPR